MSAGQQTARGAAQLIIELGPVVTFVVVYNVLQRSNPAEAIFIATGVFMAATAAAIGFAWLTTRKVPPVLWVTGVLILGFGGLTLALHDEEFIKLKPTIVNLFYAAAIFGAMLFGQNVWKLLFQHAFSFPDRIWRILATRWGLFFILMAGVNEFIRLTQSTDFWVDARIIVVYPLIFGFMMLNLPITFKYIGKTNDDLDENGRLKAAPSEAAGDQSPEAAPAREA